MLKKSFIISLVFVLVLSMVPTAFAASAPTISYYCHCQNIGDTGTVTNGAVCGTQGKSLRMEKLNIKLDGVSGGVEIQGHVQNYGWMNVSSASSGKWASCGTSGQSLRLEAIRIRLTGTAAQQYSIQYRVHVQDYGTMNWTSDWGIAGTSGESKRIESVEIKLVSKNGNVSGLTNVTSQYAGRKVTIKSVENGKYLCSDTNINSNSPLCANRDNASDWETFTFSSVTSDGWIGLKNYNGKYFTADISATNAPVRGQANSLQSWECFRIYRDNNGNCYMLSQANQKYLCVRVDTANSPVQAYAQNASTWERLKIEDRSEAQILSGNKLYSPLKPSLKKTSSSAKTNGFYCDYSAGVNTPLYAPCSGDVTFQQVTSTVNGVTKLASYANKIEFKSTDGRWKIIFAHLSSFNGASVSVSASWPYPCSASKYKCTTKTIKTIRNISAGTLIGYSGQSGNAHGAHLHLELYENVNGSWVARDPLTNFVTW